VVVTLMTLGAVATGIGWYLVARRGASIWAVFGVLNGMLGTAAIATGRVPLSPAVTPWLAAAAGVGVGVALYAGTVAFVAVVRTWPSFEHHVGELYERGAGLSLPVALGLAAALAAPGEELFWRGLFQQHLAHGGSRTPAALATWLVYVAANAMSLSLPITAAALVGGAVWAGLAAWTGGVLASLACHVVWTALMVTFPPPGGIRPSKAAA
jgi:membrane protease YdiL (CAAX protease family)